MQDTRCRMGKVNVTNKKGQKAKGGQSEETSPAEQGKSACPAERGKKSEVAEEIAKGE